MPGNCSSPYDLKLNVSYDWPVYVNPGILFLLYISLAIVLKKGCHETTNQVSYLHLNHILHRLKQLYILEKYKKKVTFIFISFSI